MTLAVVAASGARLDAGSLGLALARRWSESGEQALFIDADASGAGLAARFGAAVQAEFSPALRGLPSLMVARRPLTLALLAEHCYSLDTSRGSLWALFAPRHRDGASLAAAWLAERADDLAALSAERRVVVSGVLGGAAGPLAPLLRSAPVVAAVAPVQTPDEARALWATCHDTGLTGPDRPGRRVLIVEGESPMNDGEITAEAGLEVAGRLPLIDDERLLRPGRRDRGFVEVLDGVIGRLQALWSLAASEGLEAAATGSRHTDLLFDSRLVGPAPPDPEHVERAFAGPSAGPAEHDDGSAGSADWPEGPSASGWSDGPEGFDWPDAGGPAQGPAGGEWPAGGRRGGRE